MPDLITLAQAKQWLGIPTGQTGSDTNLQALVDATSADFLRAIDRVADFFQATFTDTRIGDGGTRLSLRHWPIAAVSSVTIAGTALSQSSNRVSAGWYIDTDLEPEQLRYVYTAGGAVFTDLASVVVAYTAGYATVPNDVQQAVIEWVADRYRERPAQGMTSQRDAGGEHVTYDKDTAMPDNTRRVVMKYLRERASLDRRNDDRNYRVTRINRTTTEVVK